MPRGRATSAAAIEVVLAADLGALAAALGNHREVVHVAPAIGALASSWRSRSGPGVAVVALGADRELAAEPARPSIARWCTPPRARSRSRSGPGAAWW